MQYYEVYGRYDLWRGVWTVKASNVDDLQLETHTRQSFIDGVNHICRGLAGKNDHEIKVKCVWPSMWNLSSKFFSLEIVNSKIVRRDIGDKLRDMYEQSG